MTIVDFRFWIFDWEGRMNQPSCMMLSSGNRKSKIRNRKLSRRSQALIASLVTLLLQWPATVHPQSKPLREIKVGYPLGGSSSYFWVAYRSGSFEKYGLKLEPIYIRGG